MWCMAAYCLALCCGAIGRENRLFAVCRQLCGKLDTLCCLWAFLQLFADFVIMITGLCHCTCLEEVAMISSMEKAFKKKAVFTRSALTQCGIFQCKNWLLWIRSRWKSLSFLELRICHSAFYSKVEITSITNSISTSFLSSSHKSQLCWLCLAIWTTWSLLSGWLIGRETQCTRQASFQPWLTCSSTGENQLFQQICLCLRRGHSRRESSWYW